MSAAFQAAWADALFALLNALRATAGEPWFPLVLLGVGLCAGWLTSRTRGWQQLWGAAFGGTMCYVIGVALQALVGGAPQ